MYVCIFMVLYSEPKTILWWPSWHGWWWWRVCFINIRFGGAESIPPPPHVDNAWWSLILAAPPNLNIRTPSLLYIFYAQFFRLLFLRVLIFMAPNTSLNIVYVYVYILHLPLSPHLHQMRSSLSKIKATTRVSDLPISNH